MGILIRKWEQRSDFLGQPCGRGYYCMEIDFFSSNFFLEHDFDTLKIDFDFPLLWVV